LLRAGTGVDFDFNREGVDTLYGGGSDLCEHGIVFKQTGSERHTMIRPDLVGPFNPARISVGICRACLAASVRGGWVHGVTIDRLCVPGQGMISGESACRWCVSGPVFDLAVAATGLEA
jgi:hypothetical protein